jgi:hypothetical protein
MDNRTFYHQAANAIRGYLEQELSIQADLHYRVQSAIDGPRVLSLGLVINPKFAPKIMTIAEQLSMAAGLDRGVSIRVARGQRGTLALEIPKPKALWYNVAVDALPRRRGLRATVGLDNDHRPALIDFSEALTPHALIAGATGSGKTNVQRLLVYDLASQNTPAEVRFLLIDTRKRGIGWRPFTRLPHLAHPVITDDDTALRALAWAVAEVDRRAAAGQTSPRLFVGIDETQALLEAEQFVRPISDLAAVGREFGIHLLAAMQNPTAKQLGDASIKRNLTTRLVGKVDSADAARVATGQGKSGANLLTGAGDFLLVQPQGITRLTAALLTEQDTARLPRSETVQALDLDQYDDVDRVADVADDGRGRPPEPVEPEHVALALASDRGIVWLARELGIGKTRATRVKEFTDILLARLSELGYSVVPKSRKYKVPDSCRGEG